VAEFHEKGRLGILGILKKIKKLGRLRILGIAARLNSLRVTVPDVFFKMSFMMCTRLFVLRKMSPEESVLSKKCL
jgi:hypothetical protein